MDTPKHTPGPWHVVESTHQQEYSHFVEAADRTIACIEKYSQRGQPPHEREEANAALIARAPDMADQISRLEADKAELVAALTELRAAQDEQHAIPSPYNKRGAARREIFYHQQENAKRRFAAEDAADVALAKHGK